MASRKVPADLLQAVVEHFNPRKVILFGSRARGGARPDSDHDLLSGRCHTWPRRMALSSSIEHAVPKQPNRHSANSWIAKADEDIDTVDLCLSAGGRLANVAAFHTQQAAEKLLKALIAMAGIEPPRVHDLAELTDLAGKAKSDVRTLAEKIETITSWAVLTRYPSHGDTPPPTTGEIADALRLVKQLRALAAKAVSG